MSLRLRHELGQANDPTARFAAVAAVAAITSITPETPKTFYERYWERFFGVLKIEQESLPYNEIFGTIIINTAQKDFCSQIDSREHFIPYLLRAFMRRENPAAALAFLAQFAVEKYDLTKPSPEKTN